MVFIIFQEEEVIVFVFAGRGKGEGMLCSNGGCTFMHGVPPGVFVITTFIVRSYVTSGAQRQYNYSTSSAERNFYFTVVKTTKEQARLVLFLFIPLFPSTPFDGIPYVFTNLMGL